MTKLVDPNKGEWRVQKGKKEQLHCVFLAWGRERSWLSTREYRRFERDDGEKGRKKEYVVKAP